MLFLNPLGFLAAASLAIIIYLHFRKKKIIKEEIPNLKFWEDLLRELEESNVKKIDKNLLLLLQLLLCSFLVLALTSPLLMFFSKPDRVSIAIDSSISMNYIEDKKTSLDLAKEKTNIFLESLNKKTKIDLYTVDQDIKMLAENLSISEAKNKIKKIRTSNNPFNFEKIANFSQNAVGEKLVVTDKKLGKDIKTISPIERFENIGFIDGAFDFSSSLARGQIKNYSDKKQKIHIQIFDDRGFLDIKEMEVGAFSSKDFEYLVDGRSDFISFKIKDPDGLQEDNLIFIPTHKGYKNEVALLIDDVFLEKALKANKNIVLLDRDSASEKIPSLYVGRNIDDKVGKTNVLNFITRGSFLDGDLQTGYLKAASNSLLSSLNLENIYFVEQASLSENDNFESLIFLEERPVLVEWRTNKFKNIITSLDFDKSNLVLRAEFPILINKIVDYALENNKSLYKAGEFVLDNGEYRPLEYLGLEEIVDINGQKKNIFVNPPPLTINNYSEKTSQNKVQDKRIDFDLSKIFIALALVFLVLEWEVFRREDGF